MGARPRCSTLITVCLFVSVISLCAQVSAQSSAIASNLLASASTTTDTPPADFVFQKSVDEVRLLFTVVDHKGKFISNLKQEDFQLLDNRQPPEKINSFQQETDLPLRVALVVDISGSVTNRFKYEQGSAIEFFKKILRPSIDKALVIGFDEKIHLAQDLTNNIDALKTAVNHLKPHGETALYDAVIFASEKLRTESEKGTRKIIVLISDGENNSSRAIMADAQQAALRAEAPIFTLSTNDVQAYGYTKGEATLELLSRYTGGELIAAHYKDQVAHAFKQVEQALRSQYALAYKPAEFNRDGRYRPVALTARETKFNVECRHGYYATKE